MSIPVSFQPFPLLGSGEGQIVFLGGELAAIAAPAGDGQAPEDPGQWRIEAGFGPCAGGDRDSLFDSLEQVAGWVARKASHRAGHCCGGCGGG